MASVKILFNFLSKMLYAKIIEKIVEQNGRKIVSCLKFTHPGGSGGRSSFRLLAMHTLAHG